MSVCTVKDSGSGLCVGSGSLFWDSPIEDAPSPSAGRWMCGEASHIGTFTLKGQTAPSRFLFDPQVPASPGPALDVCLCLCNVVFPCLCLFQCMRNPALLQRTGLAIRVFCHIQENVWLLRWECGCWRHHGQLLGGTDARHVCSETLLPHPAFRNCLIARITQDGMSW